MTKYEKRNTKNETKKSLLREAERSGGVTLFIAVTIMGILLFISFAVINIAIKSTLFAGTARESQLAFSAADSGIECALYWDIQEPNPFSIDEFVPGTDLLCNSETITSGLGGSNDVDTNPAQPHRLGGPSAQANDNTSIFQLSFTNGTCTIIEVEKALNGSTQIRSRGYNTCDTGNGRRVERGIEINYGP